MYCIHCKITYDIHVVEKNGIIIYIINQLILTANLYLKIVMIMYFTNNYIIYQQ